jgi:hypothetical protein
LKDGGKTRIIFMLASFFRICSGKVMQKGVRTTSFFYIEAIGISGHKN